MEAVITAVRLVGGAQSKVTAGAIRQEWLEINGQGHCISGASGPIAFANGDPTNKPIPVLEVDSTLTPAFKELEWPNGTPSPEAACQN
jgi:hypothetical protein